MIYRVYVSRTIDYVYEIEAPDEQTAKDNYDDGELVDESDAGYDVPWQVIQVDLVQKYFDNMRKESL
jgi:hypothetical protein